MEQGLPCVSTNEGAIPAIIEDGKTGFLIERQNAEDTANKIEILIKDPVLRRRMGAAGREKFNTCFRLDVFEKNFKNCLAASLEA